MPTRTARPSRGSGARTTQPDFSSAPTTRESIVGLSPSRSARALSRCCPWRASTPSTENWVRVRAPRSTSRASSRSMRATATRRRWATSDVVGGGSRYLLAGTHLTLRRCRLVRPGSRTDHGDVVELRSAPDGLTDDVLTQQPRSRTLPAYLRDAVDRLAGADPGLTQLRTGLQSVLGIAVGVGLVYLFVRRTGALQLAPTAGPAPVVAARNHALLIVSMLLAGMVAMMAGFMVSDRTARGQLVSSLLLPVPMLAAMVAGLAVGPYYLPSLVFVVVLMTLAVYVRRWGPPGFRSGMLAFNGGFLGFFLHAQIGLGDIGWLAALLWIGGVGSPPGRFTLLRPGAKRTLARMRRSWDARARRLLQLSIDALDTEDAGRTHALQERLRRQVVRLNESTLMIEAQLAETVPESAAAQAQRLFDVELALSNRARFAGAMGSPVPSRPPGRRAAGRCRRCSPRTRPASSPRPGRCACARGAVCGRPCSPAAWPHPPRSACAHGGSWTRRSRSGPPVRARRTSRLRSRSTPASSRDRCRSARLRRPHPAGAVCWTGRRCRRTSGPRSRSRSPARSPS